MTGGELFNGWNWLNFLSFIAIIVIPGILVSMLGKAGNVCIGEKPTTPRPPFPQSQKPKS